MEHTKINQIIQNQYCEFNELTDDFIFKKCIKTDKFKEHLEMFREIFSNYIDDKKINLILNDTDFCKKIIQPGLKGVVKGLEFNNIVKEHINNLNLSNNYEIEFEKEHCKYKVGEIPDFYIYNKNTDKIIIGMNQLDLWEGGQQSNRGDKYIINCKYNSDNIKFLGVVYNNCKLSKNKNTKKYKLFNKGFTDKTLCYVNGLNEIILNFFQIQE